MNNKAFTLVELLAVLGVLAVITTIAIPTVDSILVKNKTQLYNNQINTIKNGLKTWADDNTDYLPVNSGDTLTLNLGFLKVTGFANIDIKNPKTKKCFSNNMILTIKKSANNYEYYVDTDSGSGENCDEPNNDFYAFFRGNENLSIKKGDLLNDQGVYITDRNGTIIETTIKFYNSSNDLIENIDTNTIGKYKIVYSFNYKSIDGENKQSSIIKNVNIIE